MKSEFFDIYSHELLSLWKGSNCSGPHTKVFPFLNRRLKGSATCTKSGIDFVEYCTSCTKDLTPDTFCGGLAFRTAAIFSSPGAMPRVLSSRPKNVSLGSL